MPSVVKPFLLPRQVQAPLPHLRKSSDLDTETPNEEHDEHGEETENYVQVAPDVKGKGKENGKGIKRWKEDSDADENCCICLQSVVDRTVLVTCGHDDWCFECMTVWTEQSRKCPLCSQAIGDYLLHSLHTSAPYVKYFLPPLNTKLASHHAPSTGLHIPPTNRPPTGPHRRDHQNPRGQTGRNRHLEEGDEEETEFDRQIERRRQIYRFGLYAKHVASNVHTRYKPVPTPQQFSGNSEMISRCTSFLRRELRVWSEADVEFLVTYTISLMRSVDIRSEPAVRLLSEFLDCGGQRRNAEHFAHEVYSFLRSPYKDLKYYDSAVQYDSIPAPSSQNIEQDSHLKPAAASVSRSADGRSPSPARLDSASEASSREFISDRRYSLSPMSIRSFQSRNRSSPRAIPHRRSISPDRRNDKDGHWSPGSPRKPRRWDVTDTWISEEETARLEKLKAAKLAKRQRQHERKMARRDLGQGNSNRMELYDLVPETALSQTSLRAWGSSDTIPAQTIDGPVSHEDSLNRQDQGKEVVPPPAQPARLTPTGPSSKSALLSRLGVQIKRQEPSDASVRQKPALKQSIGIRGAATKREPEDQQLPRAQTPEEQPHRLDTLSTQRRSAPSVKTIDTKTLLLKRLKEAKAQNRSPETSPQQLIAPLLSLPKRQSSTETDLLDPPPPAKRAKVGLAVIRQRLEAEKAKSQPLQTTEREQEAQSAKKVDVSELKKRLDAAKRQKV